MRKSIAIHGKTMSYLDEGEGDIIIFGHSFLWNAEMWRPQIDHFKANYRCIVPDLWGHGESQVITEDTYTIEDIARDYLAFMNALQIDKAHLVGLSVGGMWCTQLSLMAPEKVNSLVIMDSHVGTEPEESKQGFIALINQIVNAKGFTPELIDTMVPFFYSPITLQSGSPLVERLQNILANIPEANINCIGTLGHGIFNRQNLLPVLKNIAVPSLVIVGEDDGPRPPSESKEMAELLNTRCVIIPKAGHISNLEQPKAVNKELTSFFNTINQ